MVFSSFAHMGIFTHIHSLLVHHAERERWQITLWRSVPVDAEAASEPLAKAVPVKAKAALAPAKSAPAPSNSAAKPALVRAASDPVTVAAPGEAKCLVEVKVESVPLSDTHPPGPDDGQGVL